jgi:peroxiredoxin (alkyl hydroperoxide reductase subunit C)
MKALVRKPAPIFSAPAVTGVDRGEISLMDFQGQYTVLMFYPPEVTLLCMAELLDFRAKLVEFARRGTQVLAMAVDNDVIQTIYQRLISPTAGPEEKYFTIAVDRDRSISAAYGVLIDDVVQRGLFIIDPNCILRHASVYDSAIPRSAQECLRIIDEWAKAQEKGLAIPFEATEPSPRQATRKAVRRRMARELFPHKPGSDPGMLN